MQIRIEGMRVKNVRRTTIVHCAEPPPSPVMRNSFGFASAFLELVGTAARIAGVNLRISSKCSDPDPAPFGTGSAAAEAAPSDSTRQSIVRIVKLILTQVSPSALLPACQGSSVSSLKAVRSEQVGVSPSVV